jgi:uncharacterized protein
MLHSYAFSNFRSFLERTEVSFAITEKDSVNGWVRHSPISGQRLTTALAVLGPNASGKTSLIQPLAFLGWFIRGSFSLAPEAPIPVTAHFNAADKPSEFEVIADGPETDTVLRYQLTTTAHHIVSETLEQKTRHGSWHSIFERALIADDKYSVTQNGFGLVQTQAEQVRRNVSLISWAAQFGVELAQSLTRFVLSTNLNVFGRIWLNRDETNWATQIYTENRVMQDRMRELLAQWDLGLSDVAFHEVPLPTQTGEQKKQWFAMGVHKDENAKLHLLPFVYESSGTKAAFNLLAHFLTVLENGGVIAFDELESDLHPHMLEPLLDLFSNEETNPHNAQIIFTCHSVEVLRLLQKSQTILVEKDGLQSHAWRLDSMEGVRADDNRVAKYLAGAYGAVPRLQ